MRSEEDLDHVSQSIVSAHSAPPVATTGAGTGLDQDLNPQAQGNKPTTEPPTSHHDVSLDTSEREAQAPATDRFTHAFGHIPVQYMLTPEKPSRLGSAEQGQRPEFSAMDDAQRLRQVLRGMCYLDIGQVDWKQTLFDVAMRLETGGYVPQSVIRCGMQAGACAHQTGVEGGA